MYIRDVQIENTVKVTRGDCTFHRKNKAYHALYECDVCGIEFTRKGKFRNNMGSSHNYEERCKMNSYCSKCYHPAITHENSVKSRLSKRILGEQKTDKDGYVHRFVGPDWPYQKTWNKQNRNWIREHIYVMSNHLARMLLCGEQIHHIDGDKKNNDIDNLVLLSASEHKIAHDSYELVGRNLCKMGHIRFDRGANTYVISEDLMRQLSGTIDASSNMTTDMSITI
ncbi:MAG: hypothetical protein HN726_04600 [Candidatus Magasanikbacteria bacterium]|jgi:hypothetical protein|nr:hypothetical protein [Candidatus Magasanikbacteria bacterium]